MVITTGQNKEFLERFIISAYHELQNTDYEIIVVGPPKLDLSYIPKKIRLVHVPYRELHISTISGAISKKKNFGVKQAKYDKVVISHDYLYFLPGWKKGYDKFGDFTVCTNVVLDQEGERQKDWVVWDYPGVGMGLLPYTEEFTQYQIIVGNYFVVKRDFFLENPINENLRWGEGEDVDWSLSIRKKIKFRINTESKVQFSKEISKYKRGISGIWLEGTKKIEHILLDK
ncbi:MAG: hypothetical protein UT65_C0038G0009 [Parcubacteria group bacterium GW2011_GWF2_39_8b]|nr:MAG: hypothetical protein UT65_C0038G0009 [Parcubacteria group bacterium GW2011_GWF2_39_8b]